MSFRTACHRAWLHPIRALPHPVGGYRPQQCVKHRDHDRTFSSHQSGGKTIDGLQGTCEAALTGTQPLVQGCPYHDRSHQIIGASRHGDGHVKSAGTNSSNSNFDFSRGSRLSIDTDFVKVEISQAPRRQR